VETDGKTHVYTAILRADKNSYAILIDGEEKQAGSLFEDFSPAINPPRTIPDPEDKKPEDWVDEAKCVRRLLSCPCCVLLLAKRRSKPRTFLPACLPACLPGSMIVCLFELVASGIDHYRGHDWLAGCWQVSSHERGLLTVCAAPFAAQDSRP
jgi:hypothetical protein